MNDSKLIFLISQPRSGSSLLQQLLLRSDRISSTPESWQMLQLVHTYKLSNNDGGYNAKQASINFNRYLNEADDGLKLFKEYIRKLGLSLYQDRTHQGNYFLDKTPRYYHIIEELNDLFPSAKFIFLVRNPLSVFASILDYNFKGDYKSFLSMEDRQNDLFLAPKKIGEAIHNNHTFVRYEDLISDPQKELKRLFDYLEIDMGDKDFSSYTIEGKFKDSNAIDSKSLKEHQSPVTNYLDSWKEVIDTVQKKRLASEYLQKLGKVDAYTNVYNIDDIIRTLDAHTHVKKSYFNLSFDYFTIPEKELSIPQLLKKRMYLKLGHKNRI